MNLSGDRVLSRAKVAVSDSFRVADAPSDYQLMSSYPYEWHPVSFRYVMSACEQKGLHRPGQASM